MNFSFAFPNHQSSERGNYQHSWCMTKRIRTVPNPCSSCNKRMVFVQKEWTSMEMYMRNEYFTTWLCKGYLGVWCSIVQYWHTLQLWCSIVQYWHTLRLGISIINLTQESSYDKGLCLLTPGLSKDIRCHVWPYYFLCICLRSSEQIAVINMQIT